ncbi:hypothetical protein L6164_009654 [Bauhinia variegata]|uniref:Uncharacterized protein n=1 Tax=Bauhinia variegata TaxID=167791 RepID=A0ACB9PR01_BAUVA|nr:hypothetical protein L6164_009654 [Bauhinia variegata]
MAPKLFLKSHTHNHENAYTVGPCSYKIISAIAERKTVTYIVAFCIFLSLSLPLSEFPPPPLSPPRVFPVYALIGFSILRVGSAKSVQCAYASSAFAAIVSGFGYHTSGRKKVYTIWTFKIHLTCKMICILEVGVLDSLSLIRKYSSNDKLHVK